MSDDFNVDAEVEAAPVPTDADVARLRSLAAQALRLEDEISELEERAAAKRLALRELTTRSIPLKMAELGVSRFDLVGGGRVEVDHVVAASLKKENRPKAFAWLGDNGLGDIIKRTITIRFGRGEEAWAEKFLRDLERRKKRVDAVVDVTVAANTYSATVRERILAIRAAGRDPAAEVPFELLGVWEGDVAEVKRPKAAKTPGADRPQVLR